MIIKEETLRRIIREEVERTLTVDIQWEKARDETTGQPLKHPERKAEKVFLPAFLVQLISFHEGALRGLQEDTNKANNRSLDAAGKVDALGQIFIGMEESIKTMARFAIALRQAGLLERLETILTIEHQAEPSYWTDPRRWLKETNESDPRP